MELSKQDLHLTGDPPPVDPNEFINKLWTLRRHGNPVRAFVELCLHVSRRKTYLGEEITLELVANRYKNYLQHCERNGQDGKFRKSIQNWISDADYNSEYDDGDNEALKRYT